jgi:hypothetical protein
MGHAAACNSHDAGMFLWLTGCHACLALLAHDTTCYHLCLMYLHSVPGADILTLIPDITFRML